MGCLPDKTLIHVLKRGIINSPLSKSTKSFLENPIQNFDSLLQEKYIGTLYYRTKPDVVSTLVPFLKSGDWQLVKSRMREN